VTLLSAYNLCKRNLDYISGLDLADHCYGDQHLDIDILIGCDHYWKLVIGQVICKGNRPVAVSTRLGWVLSSPVNGALCPDSAVNLITTHNLLVDTYVPENNPQDLDDLDILHQYDAVIKEQFNKGIIEAVDKPESQSNHQVHYLPHHVVVWEDKKTTKLWIVYGASAKTNGPSLNGCLYTGSKFGQKIMDIIIRF